MCRGQQATGYRQRVHPGRTPAAAHESLEDSLCETADCGGQRAGAPGCCLHLPHQNSCVATRLAAMLCQETRLPIASCYRAALHTVYSSICCVAAVRCMLLVAACWACSHRGPASCQGGISEQPLLCCTAPHFKYFMAKAPMSKHNEPGGHQAAWCSQGCAAQRLPGWCGGPSAKVPADWPWRRMTAGIWWTLTSSPPHQV